MHELLWHQHCSIQSEGIPMICTVNLKFAINMYMEQHHVCRRIVESQHERREQSLHALMREGQRQHERSEQPLYERREQPMYESRVSWRWFYGDASFLASRNRGCVWHVAGEFHN